MKGERAQHQQVRVMGGKGWGEGTAPAVRVMGHLAPPLPARCSSQPRARLPLLWPLPLPLLPPHRSTSSTCATSSSSSWASQVRGGGGGGGGRGRVREETPPPPFSPRLLRRPRRGRAAPSPRACPRNHPRLLGRAEAPRGSAAPRCPGPPRPATASRCGSSPCSCSCCGCEDAACARPCCPPCCSRVFQWEGRRGGREPEPSGTLTLRRCCHLGPVVLQWEGR